MRVFFLSIYCLPTKREHLRIIMTIHHLDGSFMNHHFEWRIRRRFHPLRKELVFQQVPGFTPRWSPRVVGRTNGNILCLNLTLDSGDSGMYPYQRTPMGNPYISPIYWVFMVYNPQESLENTINTVGTLLGVHPIVP